MLEWMFLSAYVAALIVPARFGGSWEARRLLEMVQGRRSTLLPAQTSDAIVPFFSTLV